MCNPCHWLPRATTLPVELSASTPVTEEKMTRNDDENYDKMVMKTICINSGDRRKDDEKL